MSVSGSITTIQEYVQEYHDLFEDDSFWLVLLSWKTIYVHMGGRGRLADMGQISSWEPQNNTEPIVIVGMYFYWLYWYPC